MNQQRHTNEDTLTDIFGSEEMRSPAPTEFIPKGKTAPEIAYQLVKDETYPQTQPRCWSAAASPVHPAALSSIWKRLWPQPTRSACLF